MEALLAEPGVLRVRGPMCRWDMEAEDRRGLQGRGYVRKMTGWVTNCKELAELLEGECSNLTGRREWHRRVHLIGGIAKGAQVYPPKLVKAILMVLKEKVKETSELSAFEEHCGGPVPDEQLYLKSTTGLRSLMM